MTFIFKMAWRDSRASRRRLVLFSFSIVLGIAALVAIGSFRENLRQAIEDQSKSLLGADFVVNSRQKLAPEVESQLKAVGGEQSHEVVLSSMLVVPDGRTRLVQIRALEGDFPFYGDFQTAPANAAGSLKAGHSAILEESLLLQFGLKPGDKIKLGRAEFMVLAALQKIPGESAALASISPRVFIPLSDLAATQLVKEGSFARYRYYFKLPADRDVSALVVDLKNKLSALRLNYETVTDRKRELGDAMKNATSFMSLVGFLSLFLGAIGVGSAINVYVKQKLATVATLRCLGASARTGFAIYLVQGLALGVVGAVVGTVVGILIQLSLPYIVGNFLPFSVDFFVSWRAVGRGSAAGLFVSLVFTLLPLMAVRNVSPLRALRSASGEEKKAWRDPWRFGIYLLIAVTVTVFSVMQAERKIQGLAFAAGLGVAFAVLTGVAWLLSRAARKFTPAGLPYVWRQGLANLYRPNNRTVLLLVSLGLGTFLMLTLALTRETLLQQIRGVAGNDRSNLMFFDIQDDQIEPLTQLLTKAGVPIKASAPIVTMRITSLKGKTVDELLQEDKAVKAEKPLQEGANRGRNRGQAQRPPGWTLRREYRSTFRDNLTETEKLVSGKFIPRVAPGVAKVPISVEEGLARDLGVKLDDEIVFDVQGVPMTTYVSSIRQVEWQRVAPNFFLVFPSGVLEPAPKFYVTAVRAVNPVESSRIQQAVLREFPNVSAFDLSLLLQTLDGIFSKVAFVITFLALFTVVTGIIVLASAVLTGRYQRIRESVLLRTLGASRRQIRQIALMEYAVLGALAALTGGILAVGANVLLARFVFSISPASPFLILLYAWVGVTAVTIITGLLSDRGVYDSPPLVILRQET